MYGPEMRNSHEAWRPTREYRREPIHINHIVPVWQLRKQRGVLRKSLSFVTSLSILLAFMTGIWWIVHSQGDLTYSHTETYIVQPGDTLWSIATKADAADRTDVVEEWIRNQNHLFEGQAIVPGQHLVVPVGK